MPSLRAAFGPACLRQTLALWALFRAGDDRLAADLSSEAKNMLDVIADTWPRPRRPMNQS